MPVAVLNGYPGEEPVTLVGNNNCGYVWSSNSTNWTTVRNGSATLTEISTTLEVGADYNALGGNKYRAKRAFLQFELPSNFTHCDEAPQLKIRARSITGNGRVAITSVNYTNFETPWTDWSPVYSWDSPYFDQIPNYSKLYYATSTLRYYTFSDTTDYSTITLINERYLSTAAPYNLAKNDCNTKKYIIIGLMQYTNDFLDSAPSSTSRFIFDDTTDSFPPQLILRKPWFINDRGNEPKYLEFPTNVIKPYDVGINQHNRSVPQLPFSTAIKGPISLRGKNVPYKVTT
tara:strand:- start:2322 stop:3185 length:864 start_codon:yes stop_codon:yes gene_type:complete